MIIKRGLKFYSKILRFELSKCYIKRGRRRASRFLANNAGRTSRNFTEYQNNLQTILNMQKESIYDLAYRGKTAEVRTLVQEDEKLKTAKDNNGRMLIHWAALGGHDELVKFFLSLDVPVDPTDDTNMTPLILAASAGREKVVNILITEGANVNATTDEGHSALQYAASKNWKSICVSLLNNDANINIVDKRSATPLHRAASKGNLAIVQLLLDHGKGLNIDQKDSYGNTALHLACEENRAEEAKLLRKNGANIYAKNKEGKTPLDFASPGLARQLKEIANKQ